MQTEKQKIWYEANKERIKEKRKQYYKNNLSKIKEYRTTNKDKIKKTTVNYLNKNKDLVNEKRRKRHNAKINIDNLYRIKHNIRGMFSRCFKTANVLKLSKSELILGCSYIEFKQYLESKFEPWMNWNNYGLYNGELSYGWDIDHIIPMSSAESETDILKLNHYSNLQPLCSYTNSYTNRYIKVDNFIE